MPLRVQKYISSTKTEPEDIKIEMNETSSYFKIVPW